MTLHDGGDGSDGDAHGSHGDDDGVLLYSRIFIVCFPPFTLKKAIIDFDFYVKVWVEIIRRLCHFEVISSIE